MGPERELLTVRAQGGPSPDPQPGDWEGLEVGRWGPGPGRGARGRLPVGPGDPSHPHHAIPAVLKHSHQIGHRCQLLLTLSLHSAGLWGGPQLPLKQGGRPLIGTLGHSHLGSQTG